MPIGLIHTLFWQAHSFFGGLRARKFRTPVADCASIATEVVWRPTLNNGRVGLVAKQLTTNSHLTVGKARRRRSKRHPGALDPEEARRRLRRFLQARVRHFIDLTEAGELEPYAELLKEEAGFETAYERIPICDVSVPEEPKTMAEIIAAIHGGMAGSGITYVHCRGGVGRTELAVACWLQERGQTPDEALTELADKWRSCPKSKWRPNSPETAEQVRWVKEWPIYRSTLKSPNDP